VTRSNRFRSNSYPSPDPRDVVVIGRPELTTHFCFFKGNVNPIGSREQPAYAPTDWDNNERRAAAQRAEVQRHADYLVRSTREQEARENREARERFAESQRKRQGGSKTE